MKSPILKPRSSTTRKNSTYTYVSGHLFLGHKVASELRILMRLASRVSSPFKEATSEASY